MKKIISFLFCLVFVLSLTACGRTMNGAVSDTESATDSIVSGTENAVDKANSAMQSATDSVTNDSMQLVAKITAEEAKQAALKHAGLNESDITDVDIDLDRDNGVLIYEVDFNHGGIEYDYDINAETGEVISADKDRD